MKIFAHRGYHIEFPENSLPAVQSAFEHEILHVELDIRRCKTGEIIVFHDRNLKRLTGLNKFVIQTPFSVIRNLHLKNNRGEMTDCHIPTLEEVLDAFRNKVDFILDVKKETWIEDGLEWNLMTVLKDFNLTDKVIISSFNPFVLKRIADIDPTVHTGLIVSHPLFIPLFRNNAIQSLHIPYKYVNHPIVLRYAQSGTQIFTWTVNDIAQARKMSQSNYVEAIISDVPDSLIAELSDNSY